MKQTSVDAEDMSQGSSEGWERGPGLIWISKVRHIFLSLSLVLKTLTTAGECFWVCEYPSVEVGHLHSDHQAWGRLPSWKGLEGLRTRRSGGDKGSE